MCLPPEPREICLPGFPRGRDVEFCIRSVNVYSPLTWFFIIYESYNLSILKNLSVVAIILP